MKNHVKMLIIVAAVVTAQVQLTNAQTFTVPGTADPLLPNAGDTDNYTGISGDNLDTLPAESPVLFGSVTPGQIINWSATGSTDNDPGPSGLGPNGGFGNTGFLATPSDPIFFDTSNFGSFQAPFNSLIGVFTGPNYAELFEMGASGHITIPVGATELYLASMDSYQWNNNYGAFTVTVANGVPDGGMTFGLLGGALVVLQGIRRKLSS
jgi:hypothetical protein